MNTRIIKNGMIYAVITLLFFSTFTAVGISQNNEQTQENQDPEIYDMMWMDKETFQHQQALDETLEGVYINPNLKEEIQATSSYSILDLVDYIPSERNQGWCGNCWAWPSTSVLQIALYVQEGIFDRLSVQYLNSCGYERGIDCCEGGTISAFANFYSYTGFAIPWSNDNAEWQDRFRSCNTACEEIETEPNYPISRIRSKSISINRVPQEEAIENIKNVLHQNRGVYFSFFLPTSDDLMDFNDFWSKSSESSIYQLDSYLENEVKENEVAGHAVLCVGYNDEAGTSNDYWVMLNSWGTASHRSNGLFRIAMDMDYRGNLTKDGNRWGYAFGAKTLNVTFGSEPESPDDPTINGPVEGKTKTLQYYEFSSTDHQGDRVYYKVDWGDGDIDGWIGPFESDETIELSHSWDTKGTYEIKAKAKDSNWKESDWTTLEVSMTKHKKMIQSPYWIFQFHVNIQNLIEFLLNKC